MIEKILTLLGLWAAQAHSPFGSIAASLDGGNPAFRPGGGLMHCRVAS
jgi:hypothetical protein